MRLMAMFLNDSGDIARLYERLHVAALDVCKSAQGPGHQDVESWIEWDRCVRNSMAKAVKAVHNEKLSAYRWERIYSRKLYWSSTWLSEERLSDALQRFGIRDPIEIRLPGATAAPRS
jgi:hypothetical protein